MKYLKSTILLMLLSSILFNSNPIYAGEIEDVNKMSIDEIVYQMTRTHPPKTFITDVVSKSNKEPEFRKELVSALTRRLSEVTANIQISNTVRSLRDLNATETVMPLIKIWNESEKVTRYLEFADPRIQLLITIAQFLPEGERVLFLIKTESDETEAPIVRFRATILLCTTGNQKAIDNVLSVYNKAKEKYPTTLIMPLESQNSGTPRKTESDEDGDFFSSYIEKGLLLDPNNIDTDGDGLRDGNDRNPLCKSHVKGELTDDQEIAHFIFYLYTKYYDESSSPFSFRVWLVRPTDYYDGTDKPSLFANVQFTGIDGVILQMNREQIDKFRAIHGFGTSDISLHKEPEDGEQKGTKKFVLIISSGPGNFRSYDMTFKRFGNVWLPVFWELFMIT